MAPLPAARKDHWKVVFQNAWDVVEEDVDRGGKTANDESGKEMVCFRVKRLKGERWNGTARQG